MKKLCFYSLLFLSCKVCPAQNLVLNPGFETATIGLPTGDPLTPYPTFNNNWSAVNTDGEFMYDVALAHTGTGFLSVLQNTGANAGAPWLGAASAFAGYDRALQIVPVTPSTNYQLQFWVRSGDNLRYGGYAAGNALVQVEQFMPTSIFIDSFSVYTPLTWQQMTFNFTTGSNCTSVALLFSVYDASAADAWFDDIDLRVNETSGIDQPTAAAGFSVFPNPVTDKLNATGNTLELSEITVYDVAGRKIIEQKFTRYVSLNTEQLAKGIYTYAISNEKGLIKKGKVIKN